MSKRDIPRYDAGAMFESLHRQHLLNQGPFRTGYCSTIIHHILCDLFCSNAAVTQPMAPQGMIGS